MSSTRSFTRPAGDRHRQAASCGSRALRTRAIVGHYATKTLGSRTGTTGKDSLRDAWGCWLLPVCSGISHASWQSCPASPLLCQDTAQNQEPLCCPAGAGQISWVPAAQEETDAAAAWLGPGAPGNIDCFCSAAKKEAETCWEAAARAGCPDTGPGCLFQLCCRGSVVLPAAGRTCGS